MEVFCRVADQIGPDATTGDVRVELEPSHRVGDLTAALLGSYPTLLRPDPEQVELVRVATGEVLDGSCRWRETGLVSGEELVLRRAPGRLPAPASGGPTPAGEAEQRRAEQRRADQDQAERVGAGVRLEVVVASGPDTGRRQTLEPGRHDVGRDRSCRLALDDPRLDRVSLVLEVTEGPAGTGPTVTVHPVDPGDAGRSRPTRPSAGRAGTDATQARTGRASDRVPAMVGSRGGVLVDGRPVSEPTVVTVGQVVGVGATTLRFQPVPVPPSARPEGPVVGEVPFHRTPYFPTPVEGRVLDPMGDIPERPEPARFAWLAALAPLAMGVTLALVYSPRFLLFALFTPVLAVAGYFDQRRRTSRRYGRGAARYRRRLELRRAEIAAARHEERRRRFANAPDLAELAGRAAGRTVDLWVRDRRATDFLTLRLGLGPVASAVTVRPETRGDEVLREELAAELAAGAVLAQVPVILSLVERPVTALIGAIGDTTALADSLVTQAACLHSPEDLVIVAATAPARRAAVWLKWLPHTRPASSPLAGPHLAQSPPAADRLLRELLVVAEERAVNPDRSIDRRWPRLLAVIDRALEPDPTMVSRLTDLCPQVGISVLWLTTGDDRVPRQVVATVTCQPATNTVPSRLAITDPAVADQDLQLERGPAALVETVARSLAGVRDASSATAASALPRLVTLHQALGTGEVTPAWVMARWQPGPGHAVVAPVGLGPAGPLVLDLVEHGPHALIGGTSGAGKSELLMSLVAGLVATNPPTRVNLLFIDYKGGAASDTFRGVPHTVGHVTNLDALLARRALVSLRAELTRRMALLQGRAKDLAEMSERHPADAPPSLVLVIDEFATLVKEVPDFVAGVVDIAQRGRSLGIHLLLATQRPSGAVNENILANTNLRISLRMIDGAESVSVIGTPDAAAIPPPLKGRGFARMGPGQLVAFQTAWSGAPLVAAAGPPPVTVAPFEPVVLESAVLGPPPMPGLAATVNTGPGPGPGTVATPDEGGRPTADLGPAREHHGAVDSDQMGREPSGSGRLTQLDGLLAAVRVAATTMGLGPARSPWLDELPAHLPLATLLVARSGLPSDGPAGVGRPGREWDGPTSRLVAERGRTGDGETGWSVVLGLVDDPAAQAQYPARIDLSAGGGLLVVGTGGSGRTTTLRTLAVSAALGAEREAEAGSGPDRGLSIVVLDFASRDLLALRVLPCCAVAAAGDDLEAVTRAIALLDRSLQRRRAALAEAALVGAAPPLFPSVLLLIDDYGNLAQSFEGTGSGAQLYPWLEALNRVIVDGRQVGMHTALSAGRRAVVKAGILSAITNRLVLRQADRGGYTDLGLPSSVVAEADLPPGRGFLEGGIVTQVASLASVAPGSPGSGSRSGDGAETAALRAVAATLTVGPSPELTLGSLPADLAFITPPSTPWQVTLGRADLDPDPVTVDLGFDDLLVVGEPRSGRSTALATTARQLAVQGIEVWAVGPPGSGLAALLPDGTQCRFGRPTVLVDLLNALASALDSGVAPGELDPGVAAGDLAPVGGSGVGVSRSPGSGEAVEVGDASSPGRVLVIDDVDLLEDPVLDPVLGRLVALGVRWVAATTSLRGYSTNALVQEMKKSRVVLHLRPAGSREVQELTGVNPGLRPGLPLPPGRGVLVANRQAQVVQIASPPPAPPPGAGGE